MGQLKFELVDFVHNALHFAEYAIGLRALRKCTVRCGYLFVLAAIHSLSRIAQ